MKINSYYKQKQIVARVDKNGNEIGKIEKWEAHKKGILHRGFALILTYKNYYLIQHRKHPAFDGVFDLSFASHQILANNKFQDTKSACLDALEREWNIPKKDLVGDFKNLGFIYYKEKDKKSIFTEHEICDILVIGIKKLPDPNLDFAYGFSLLKKDEVLNNKSRVYDNFSPWAKEIIKRKLI